MMITRLSMDEQLTAGPAAETADDGLLAEQAWRNGDAIAAMAAADRVLATGTRPGRAGGRGGAAAAAADGALLDAAARWRGVAGAVDGTAGVWAHGRAALAAGLAGRRRRPPRATWNGPAGSCPTRPRAGWPCWSPGSAPSSTRCRVTSRPRPGASPGWPRPPCRPIRWPRTAGTSWPSPWSRPAATTTPRS